MSFFTSIVFMSIITFLRSNVNGLKDSICEEEVTHIDGIIDYKNYRQIISDEIFYEYDYNNEFRRKGIVDLETQDYQENDLTFELASFGHDEWVHDVTFKSGFFIPKIDCSNGTFQPAHVKDNCTVINDNFSNVLVIVLSQPFYNKHLIISKRYEERNDIYRGIESCRNETVVVAQFCETQKEINENLDNRKEAQDQLYEGEEEEQEQESLEPTNSSEPTDSSEPISCGPYTYPGRSRTENWLLKGLASGKRFKKLPLFYDPKKWEILIILNKEYELLTEKPRLLRQHARLYWKSITYEDPGFGWHEKPLSDEYTYTAFLRDGETVYLIAEPFYEDPTHERGTLVLLVFDLNKKQVIEKKRESPLDLLFGCSPKSSNLFGYIIIAILCIILLLVISAWVFACYWFYSKESRTTKSVNIEST